MHSEPLINPNYPPIPTEIYKEKYTVSIKTSAVDLYFSTQTNVNFSSALVRIK